jgi:hypothetical protein
MAIGGPSFVFQANLNHPHNLSKVLTQIDFRRRITFLGVHPD